MMAGLSLKHVYKVYQSKDKQKKRKKGKDDAGKRVGDYLAVKDFNMEIEDGEFIVFVGPSGCGKSTTLRMIAGLEDISAGDVYIGDRLVNDVDPKERDIAMVFQNYALYPHMTAGENISFGLRMRKTKEGKVDANGKPVLAINKKRIREIKASLKTVAIDIRYAEESDTQGAFTQALRELKVEYEAILADKAAEADGKSGEALEAVNKIYTEKIADIEKRVTDILTAQKAALNFVKLKYSSKSEDVKAEAQKNAISLATAANVNLSEVKEGEIKLALLARKEKLEKELKYYSETPVPVYVYKHLSKEYIAEKVKWASEILGVKELLDIKPKAMSGGQRQRIALGRAIAREPKVMLLAEPI